MTDTEDIVDAADRAFALVEAIDESWVYRYAAQSFLEVDNTTAQSVMCQPDADPALLVYDTTEPAAWVQGDFQAVGR